MQTSRKATKTKIHLSIPAKTNYLASIRQLALDVARSTRLSEDEILDFSLAVIEASSNAIRHSKSDFVNTVFYVEDGCLTCKVIDKGCGFEPNITKGTFPPSSKQGGRGIPLMNNLVDAMKIKSQFGYGTEVVLVKSIKKGSRARGPGSREKKLTRG